MASRFTAIIEDFEEELGAIAALVAAAADPALGRPRARVAGANAAVLLLAATFEEFIREVARAFARSVVESCESYDKLPPKLASVAWRRTMEALARVQLNPKSEVFSRESVFADAQTRFSVTYEFCRGDLTQDIYDDLIHNQNNMRPGEINSLFGVSGLKNTCYLAADNQALKDLLNEQEQGSASARLVERIEDFFERRNQVAHSINAMRSSGPGMITADIELLRTLARALVATVEEAAPAPFAPR
jgi:hypothetical protein